MTAVTQFATLTSRVVAPRRTAARAAAAVRVRGRCTIAAGSYACTVRLAPGRWAIATRALSGRTLVASAVKRVRISRGTVRGGVTG